MAEQTEHIARLVGSSSVIVRATVSQLHASNEPTVSANERLIIAQVDAVLRAGPALGRLAGRAVTIELAPNHGMSVGERAIFFTNGLAYGTQVVLREEGHCEATAQNEKEVSAAIEGLPLRHLESRLHAADVVIVGTVRHVRPSGIKEPISFHSPKWMRAEVHVSNSLKGKRGHDEVEVLFPSARDVLWAHAPRLHEGDEGIFLLRRGVAKWGATADTLTALDPGDFQPIDALSRIRSLLKEDH
jgi:hypothetical protein